MSFLRNQIDRLTGSRSSPKIFSKVFSIFIIFSYCIIQLSCSGKNLKLQGEPNRLAELPFYGGGFLVSASKIEKEDLEDIRKDLKNELASRIPKDRVEKWKELNALDGSEGIYILFQIVPETRVLPEFLEFQFSLNEKPPEKTWSYYVQTFTARVRNSRFSALPVYGTFGYPFYTVPPGVYPSGTVLYDSDVTAETEHIYRFLIRFPKDVSARNSRNKVFFQVVTPAKSILLFEY
ncbi:hypothetical protein [Leptospira alstonii]|uniref:hypothetical protein n=1 Tax=Leptospira alstonii TaxID=28452 RepID=UPI000772F008|nr:hypothetical protein [Leptospira alstonii]